MGQKLIDIIGEIVQISGNSTVDSILFGIIGVISFCVAFDIVGLVFGLLGFYDSKLMSDAHWIIRVAVFVGLTYFLVKLAQGIAWLCGFQWWVYLIAFVVIVGIVILIYWIKHRKQKSKNSTSTSEQNTLDAQSGTITTQQELDDRNCCPRCDAKLVKRHGPYGDFYGCESYGKTGCTYTRKFL